MAKRKPAAKKPSEEFKRSTGNEVLRFSALPYFPRNSPAIEEIKRSLMAHCRTPAGVTEAVTHFLELPEPHIPTGYELQQWAYNKFIGQPKSERVSILRKAQAGDPCKICDGDGQYEKSGHMPVDNPETGEKTRSRFVTWVAYCPCAIGQALKDSRQPVR